MRFLDITAERFGVLNGAELTDLSPGMTVVYGANGSGKTTMVKFVEGLLFGYSTIHQAFQPDDTRFGGSASLQSDGRSYRVTRERSHGVTTELSTVDLATGVSVTAPDATLPDWINHTVYDEIFSVGDAETSRFDLLTRLCLSTSGPIVPAEEIRRVELAIDECRREREGNGVEGGLRQQISSLEIEKDNLNAQLTRLRQSDPRIPERIAAIQAELRTLHVRLAECDRQIRETEAEIRELENRLAELRRRNVVALNRIELESQITQLQDRQARWDEIRKAINREIGALPTPDTGLRNRDSLKSVRALVSRLEQRMEALSSDHALSSLSVQDRDVFVDHIRGEVFSLCDYVAHHESAVDAHEVVLESLFGQRTLQDAENVNTVLQGQIEALREELNRSEDVLSVRQDLSYTCPSTGHQEYLRSLSGRQVNGTIEALERELALLRQQLEGQRSDRSQILLTIERLQQELASLEARNHSVGTLEDIDRIKAQIAEADASLVQLRDRWQTLEETELQLEEVLDRLSQHHSPQVLELASVYIRRLTGGDCYRLESDPTSTRILASTNQSSVAQAVEHLSRGTRDQVALALRLALIQTRATEGRSPLILDDVFISSDDERAAAVADLLMEVADDGQQIIFFTCQNDVRSLFERRNASIRYLENRPVAAPVPVAVVPAPVRAPAPKPVIAENTNWLFYLEVDNSVEDLSGLTVAEVEAVRTSSIETIDDLLTLSLDDLEARIRNHGYSISRDRIRAWRGQAEMATLVPMLRRADAELIYASGIESTVELSRMRPETVFDMVTAFQNTQDGNRFRRSGRSIDRQQSINWSRWSQHARSLTEARQSRSRFFVRATDDRNSPHSAPAIARVIDGGESSQDRSSRSARQRRLRTSSVPRTRRQPRPALSTSDRREVERRKARRRERMQRHSSSYRTTSDVGASETVHELRFYLNRSDDVEAAPSIGPKTAQRLGQVGVYTVDDLLNADGIDISARLNNRRISADTIVTWQAQAKLVCTIPELRGHDAQILVACGVTEAEQLAGKRPADLYAVVGPFSETSEGERIIRNGKKPDLEEVTDWIRFAQQARSLKAAA